MTLATIKEISAFLKVKESTLYSWVKNGYIPSYKLNGLLRFDMKEIEEWVKNSKFKPYSGNMANKRMKNQDIGRIIKKAIEGVQGKGYNSANGKPGRKQGLRKEV